MSPSRDAAGRPERIALQMVDVTEQVRAQDRLQSLALSDPLTGLANRALLEERLRHWVDLDAGAERPLLLMFLDLDDFKIVNDSSGHVVGDEVLMAVASRLTAVVREPAMVARLGGDEFVILVPHLDDDAERHCQALADDIIAAVCQPVQVRERQYRVGASVGMTLSRPDSTSESLLREADTAMFQAKREGKNRQSLFSQSLQDAALRRITLDAELHDAVERDEFELHIQPVVHLATGRLIGGECLIRWRHPVRGLLLPEEWLDVVQESSLVHTIGAWVIGEACRLAAGWPVPAGGAPLVVHANVAAQQLGTSRLVEDVQQALTESGLRADRLVLEITETELAREFSTVSAQAITLRRLGVRLAADDVGTGYSSLTRLTDMPIDIVKIDRTFVHRMTHDLRARAVVDSLVRLGCSMGLEVVAEGVENARQAADCAISAATAPRDFTGAKRWTKRVSSS